MPRDGLTYKERIRAKLFEIQIGRPMTKPVIATVTKPREECRVALITTGGIHLKNQAPFTPKNGDHSFRLIPRNTSQTEITVTHGHYDETDVRADVNCLLPMDRLEELVKEGFVASSASSHISFMGYIPDVGPLVNETAPEAARILLEDGVDIVVLTPG
ncbi:Glycine/sarcosine/betaine reductase selenoprotein B (GRDB) [Anoxynatronum buryatiense]|uniref:Glycine/sarcosine/betaine reductase selenoprotein B (GRDB) n=2 Tax=Anoxynatronum buryatiense TaxID=489973 RepID=A0AA46AJX5_9CLOT|nr:Glycine/sarcosine/betaine reductase selenoprotein B (GRDB) [Anoxynatronum buryatiense]